MEIDEDVVTEWLENVFDVYGHITEGIGMSCDAFGKGIMNCEGCGMTVEIKYQDTFAEIWSTPCAFEETK